MIFSRFLFNIDFDYHITKMATYKAIIPLIKHFNINFITPKAEYKRTDLHSAQINFK